VLTEKRCALFLTDHLSSSEHRANAAVTPRLLYQLPRHEKFRKVTSVHGVTYRASVFIIFATKHVESGPWSESTPGSNSGPDTLLQPLLALSRPRIDAPLSSSTLPFRPPCLLFSTFGEGTSACDESGSSLGSLTFTLMRDITQGHKRSRPYGPEDEGEEEGEETIEGIMYNRAAVHHST